MSTYSYSRLVDVQVHWLWVEEISSINQLKWALSPAGVQIYCILTKERRPSRDNSEFWIQIRRPMLKWIITKTSRKRHNDTGPNAFKYWLHRARSTISWIQSIEHSAYKLVGDVVDCMLITALISEKRKKKPDPTPTGSLWTRNRAAARKKAMLQCTKQLESLTRTWSYSNCGHSILAFNELLLFDGLVFLLLLLLIIIMKTILLTSTAWFNNVWFSAPFFRTSSSNGRFSIACVCQWQCILLWLHFRFSSWLEISWPW